MADFNIVIVGLGLMGGSLAYALEGFEGCTIIGVDQNETVLAAALEKGVVSRTYTDITQAIPDADLTIFCTYPESIFAYIEKYHNCFKPGSVVTDICGVKGELCEAMENMLPANVDYVGIHPMAGKEVDGFANADVNLFKGTGFIITPINRTKPESTKLMERLAAHIGAARVAITSAKDHDDIIAYTSDLMHISAAALCIEFHPGMTLTHTAGAFRDCTRVANLNPELWTQLLLKNGNCITPHLEQYIENLKVMDTAIKTQDYEALYELLAAASRNKKELLTK